MSASAFDIIEDQSLWSRLTQRVDEDLSTWESRRLLWLKAQQLGLPKKKDERYTGVRLRALESFLCQPEPVASFVASPVDSMVASLVLALGTGADSPADLILLNGKKVHSSSTCPLMTLKQIQSMGPMAAQRLQQLLEREKDPWALINGSLATESIWGRVPDHFKGKLKLYFVSQGQNQISFPRLTLWIGKGAHLDIELVSLGESSHLSVELVDLVQEPQSSVRLSWSRRSGEEALALNFLRATLKRDCQLHFCDLSEGSLISRLDADIQLLESGCNAKLYGLNLLEKQRHSQMNVLIEHAAPDCESTQLFKNALKDSSRSSFQGKIYIQSQAQKTQAYQICRNLVLSPTALAQSRPNLEIFADDVKASHGSTTGEVDQEAFFYLLARGIEPQIARSLLVHGFSLEILQYVESDALRQIWKEKIDRF